MGKILHFCCDVLTTSSLQSLDSRAAEIENYLRLATDNMHTEHQNLLNISTTLIKIQDHFSNEISTNAKIIEAVHKDSYTNGVNIVRLSKVQATISQTINHAIYALYQLRLTTAYATCHGGYLPKTFVTPGNLQHDIQIKENELSNIKGNMFELVFPISELHNYYKYTVANCLEGNPTYVNVKIPLKPRDFNWKIQKVTVIPFQLRYGEVCQIAGLPKYFAADIEKQKIRLLSENQYVNCDETDATRLCFIPQFDAIYNAQLQCLHHLYFSAKQDEIQKHCKLDCHHTYELITLQLRPQKFLITNTESVIRVQCKDESNSKVTHHDHRLHIAGAISINLMCVCKIIILNPDVIIEPSFPCQEAHTKLQIIQSIPGHFIVAGQELQYIDQSTIPILGPNKNLSQILEHRLDSIRSPNFTVQIQALNKEIRQETIDKMPLLFDISITNYPIYLFIWLLSLSVVCIGLVLYLIRIAYIKLKRQAKKTLEQRRNAHILHRDQRELSRLRNIEHLRMELQRNQETGIQDLDLEGDLQHSIDMNNRHNNLGKCKDLALQAAMQAHHPDRTPMPVNRMNTNYGLPQRHPNDNNIHSKLPPFSSASRQPNRYKQPKHSKKGRDAPKIPQRPQLTILPCLPPSP